MTTSNDYLAQRQLKRDAAGWILLAGAVLLSPQC